MDDPPHPFRVAPPRAETAARIAGDRGPVGSPRCTCHNQPVEGRLNLPVSS